MSRPAVFLDRDGVLIRDIHLLTRCEQVELFPFASAAVRRLGDAGYAVIVVTNQPVVARGLASEVEVQGVHHWIQNRLTEDGGGSVEQFYYCPHHPHATLLQYRCDCNCRKPRPGMILSAASDMDLSLRDSWLVGDRITDIMAGQSAGCRTILVKSGSHEVPLIEIIDRPQVSGVPDFSCADLSVAAEIIYHMGV